MHKLLYPSKPGGQVCDHIIASFSGFGSAKDKPYPVDTAHKYKLMFLRPGPDAKPLWQTALEASKYLAAARHKDLEEDMKNS